MNQEHGIPMGANTPDGVYPAVIKTVNSVDAAREGDPEAITYDVIASIGGNQILIQGLENSWRRLDSTEDGVSVTVRAFMEGVFVPIIVFGGVAQLCCLEHISVRACPA